MIFQKLQTNDEAIGIFGYSFLDQNGDVLQAFPVAKKADGPYQAPTFNAIAVGTYPISRSLYFYVKKAHVDVVPGIREYLAEFISDKAAGDFGYLADRGLIPLSEADRAENEQTASALTKLVLE